MTLDQLIEAAQNPTPEIVEEVCKRVHKTMGLCWHKWIKTGFTEKGALLGLTHEDYECECSAETFWPQEETDPVPTGCDYTRPENFWPLVEEYEMWISPIDCDEGCGKWSVLIPQQVPEAEINHDNPGLAVCLAYLKIKEQENG